MNKNKLSEKIFQKNENSLKNILTFGIITVIEKITKKILVFEIILLKI
jgi:hypothetical protein